MTKRLIQRIAFTLLLTLAIGLALLPSMEMTATAVPFCAAVEPGFPCDELCYCTSEPHMSVVVAGCCLETYLICSD